MAHRADWIAMVLLAEMQVEVESAEAHLGIELECMVAPTLLVEAQPAEITAMLPVQVQRAEATATLLVEAEPAEATATATLLPVEVLVLMPEAVAAATVTGCMQAMAATIMMRKRLQGGRCLLPTESWTSRAQASHIQVGSFLLLVTVVMTG
mmetsp:Transcript_66443/g.121319  ORF Transcript_66443/g.121319 Transcript_66443/m.121319 type:complete len:152 (-) Transcript_66443:217-672(-)